MRISFEGTHEEIIDEMEKFLRVEESADAIHKPDTDKKSEQDTTNDDSQQMFDDDLQQMFDEAVGILKEISCTDTEGRKKVREFVKSFKVSKVSEIPLEQAEHFLAGAQSLAES